MIDFGMEDVGEGCGKKQKSRENGQAGKQKKQKKQKSKKAEKAAGRRLAALSLGLRNL